ncbi:hypothetical protein K443DRAFT_7101 [Laccaria amethystina LaAM-08-1]|uniref:F-box domain-containing protein n=1 Tax=Laccaria amethystina LaAM-08-1 TaxID=1095629 RepID=A0A0C9XZD7_9AGAR|nr:hypothetical protein K443DRAFT_7101 [Laccaria amethystina LaAM-08-1]
MNMSGFAASPNPQFDKLDDPFSTDFYEIQKTVDVARRRIDQDIEKMEGAILALKSRRNSLAAISRLPPEILSKIFPPMSHAIGEQWPWVASVMDNACFCATKFGYMRSKSTKAVQLAMNHISRVREFSAASLDAPLEKLFSNVPRAAPMLQILALSGLSNPYADRFGDNYSIPPELFSDDSSQLRRPELMRCNLDWTSHLLKGLTHLKIHDTAPGTRPSMPLFLDVLDQLPTLTVLDLDNALPHVADGSSTVSYQRNVKLLSLTNLHLSGSDSDCANALSHLSVSSSTTLKLSCRSTVVSDAHFSGILTFVSGLWGPTADISSAAKPRKCPIRSLKIGSMGLNLQAWPTVLSFQTLSGDPDPPPSIDLYFQRPGIGDKIIGETCAALSLDQLASLDVLKASEITEQTLLRTFGELAHLRYIRAPALALHTLLSAMTAGPGTATSTNVSANLSTRKRSHYREEMPPAVYFPSLLHLTIKDTDFDSAYNGEYAEVKDLKDCLMERYERKAEVRELTLSRCHRLTTEHVDELTEIVVDVIWDGLGTGFIEVSEDDYGDDTDDHSYDGFDSDDDSLF